MRTYKIVFLAMILAVYSGAFAQNNLLTLPRNVQKSIENQTRTLLGEPGENYWLNYGDYVMEATFNAAENCLDGHAAITYYNNAPDTLKNLVLNLPPNIYKKGGAREFAMSPSDLTDGMLIKSCKVNEIAYSEKDNEARWSYNFVKAKKTYNFTGTKMAITLENPLLPNDSVVLEMEWNMKIPEISTIRAGKCSDSSYFIAYWYPQVAVYDDIDGWDMINYRGSVESYNDFNNYDVTITVPDDWIVWATGELQNSSTLFHKTITKKFNAAHNSEKTINIVTQEDYKRQGIFKDKGKHDFHFFAESVPDFAFAVGRGMNWDGRSVTLDSKSVFVDAVYHKNSVTGVDVIEYACKSVNYMTYEFPGVEFPYPAMTIYAAGRGGMEFPMIVNDGDSQSAEGAFNLTFHETYHSYTPFYMGTNEKKYAWMDEGFAEYFSAIAIDSMMVGKDSWKSVIKQYQRQAGNEFDIPLMVNSHLAGADYASYRVISYIKPSVMYHFLREEIGDEAFKSVMRHYMITWAGKHPLPWDFFGSVEKVTGQDFTWFIKPWFYDWAYPDLAIISVDENEGEIEIENRGGLPMPIALKVIYEDDKIENIEKSASIWSSGGKTVVPLRDKNRKLKKVTLGNDMIPDINNKDNIFLNNNSN